MDEVSLFVNNHFKLLSVLAALSFAGFVAWLTVNFSTRKEHQALMLTVDELSQEITRLKGDVEHLPKRGDVQRLENIISALAATVAESQKGIETSISRLERKTDLLLENELRGSNGNTTNS